jgi:hypothetical protein
MALPFHSNLDKSDPVQIGVTCSVELEFQHSNLDQIKITPAVRPGIIGDLKAAIGR